ncbi:MAG TPA: hypothetical protein VH143_24905 [Kofleriaceae bacterium]|nr:hypothetical protein [Kofleriaceae bacterium]
MKLAVCLLLVACGDNEHGDHASVDAAVEACSAHFSGEFAEASSSTADCPNLVNAALDFAMPVATLDGSVLAIEIDLPSAAPGSFSSETVDRWSASVFEAETNGGCLYRAGNAATPQGSFTLALDSVAPLHGSLTMALAILTLPGSVCGQIDTEIVTSTF